MLNDVELLSSTLVPPLSKYLLPTPLYEVTSDGYLVSGSDLRASTLCTSEYQKTACLSLISMCGNDTYLLMQGGIYYPSERAIG